MDADAVERFLHLREEEKHTGDSWGFEGKCRPLLLLFLSNSHLPSEALLCQTGEGCWHRLCASWVDSLTGEPTHRHPFSTAAASA